MQARRNREGNTPNFGYSWVLRVFPHHDYDQAGPEEWVVETGVAWSRKAAEKAAMVAAERICGKPFAYGWLRPATKKQEKIPGLHILGGFSFPSTSCVATWDRYAREFSTLFRPWLEKHYGVSRVPTLNELYYGNAQEGGFHLPSEEESENFQQVVVRPALRAAGVGVHGFSRLHEMRADKAGFHRQRSGRPCQWTGESYVEIFTAPAS
jgi:hypothetical protein